MSERDPTRLSTRVGHAEHGDNRFRGRSVRDELTGALPYWSLISVAVGHRPLDADECDLLDALSVAACAADPRIWPLKAVRLGSAGGSATLGMCAGLLVTDGVHGPRSTTDAARLFATLRARVGDDDGDDALAAALAPELAARILPLPGFGVAARPLDERVAAFDDWCARAGRSLGPTWALMRRVEARLVAQRRTPVNITGATAALLLDLGFTPAQVHLPALFVAIPNFVANAAEGAAQAPAVLRELPTAAVRYVGRPPRRSPRAP